MVFYTKKDKKCSAPIWDAEHKKLGLSGRV